MICSKAIAKMQRYSNTVARLRALIMEKQSANPDKQRILSHAHPGGLRALAGAPMRMRITHPDSLG